MSNAETKTAPTHRVYSVMKNGSSKPTWTEIGAAFEHKDGKGLSLVLAARPLEGAQIVLRQPKAGTATAPQTKRGRYDALKTPAAEVSAP